MIYIVVCIIEKQLILHHDYIFSYNNDPFSDTLPFPSTKIIVQEIYYFHIYIIHQNGTR